jgi:outer membrane protein
MSFRLALRFAPALLLAAVALAPAAGAQTARFGYLDPDIIIVRMPEYAGVQSQLQARQREIASELQAREDSIRTEIESLRAMSQSSVTTPQARQEREQGVMRMQAEYEQRQQSGLQELGRREAELLQPVLERLQTAIDEVAAQQGLTMVFAARANNAPVLLYASDAAVNLTEPVMSRLGLSMDTPAAGEPPGADD